MIRCFIRSKKNFLLKNVIKLMKFIVTMYARPVKIFIWKKKLNHI